MLDTDTAIAFIQCYGAFFIMGFYEELNDIFKEKEHKTIPPPIMPKLKIGQEVNHKIFGKGIIQEIEGEVSIVNFENLGLKRIMSRYAGF